MSTLTAPQPDMGAMSLRVGRAQRDFKPKSKVGTIGIVFMVLFHLGLGYALYAGLGSKVVQLVKKPLDATIIEEVKLPPPPPPPPPKPVVKQEVAKVDAPPPPAYVPPAQVVRNDAPSPIAAVQNAEPVAPPPAAPPAPVVAVAAPAAPAPPKPVSSDIGVACPKQVRPEPPQKAIDDGISGIVKAEVRIKGGKVVEVKMLSGPKVYYAAVRSAIMQYECASSADEVVARQEFDFKVE